MNSFNNCDKVVRCIIASVITFKNYKAMKGGVIGESFIFVLIALVILTLGVAFKGLNEEFGLTTEFLAEVIFELFIHTSIVLMVIGGRKASM